MYRGTIDTSPALTGINSMNAAVKLLAGPEIPQNIAVTVTLVNADNVAEMLAPADAEESADS